MGGRLEYVSVGCLKLAHLDLDQLVGWPPAPETQCRSGDSCRVFGTNLKSW